VSGGRTTHLPTLTGLLGLAVGGLGERLGPPDVDRPIGRERWLIYHRQDLTLRIRCTEADSGDPGLDSGERVASWTVNFANGYASLREALEELGLWPAAAPDRVPRAGDRMFRRALPDPEGGPTYSLTAAIRDMRIVQITAFDEPPEWLNVSDGAGHGERD